MNGFQLANGARFNIDWCNMVISCVDTGSVMQFRSIDCVIGRQARISLFPCGEYFTECVVIRFW